MKKSLVLTTFAKVLDSDVFHLGTGSFSHLTLRRIVVSVSPADGLAADGIAVTVTALRTLTPGGQSVN